MTSPGPSVFVNNVSAASVEFKAFFWAADISTVATLKSLVLTDIYELLNKEGIAMPSPQKDFYLHFPEGDIVLKTDKKGENDEGR